MEKPEIWYRAEDTQYAGPVDDYGDPSGYPGPIEINIIEVKVLRHTPCGVFVAVPYSFDKEEKFINKKWNKQYAHPTKKEALESLIARRKRGRSINLARATQIKKVIALAKHMLTQDLSDESPSIKMNHHNIEFGLQSRWSFDDLYIGKKIAKAGALKTRVIARPAGLTKDAWYNFAGEIIKILNSVKF